MNARPILMSRDCVRAIRAGRKTETRRPVRNKAALEWLAPGMFTPEFVASPGNGFSPYGYVDDLLWVRETYSIRENQFGPKPVIVYAADLNEDMVQKRRGEWLPSIYMPRGHARLYLRVDAVRIERLQAMTSADVARSSCNGDTLTSYAALWDRLNARRGFPWSSNPWVWVVTFHRRAGLSR